MPTTLGTLTLDVSQKLGDAVLGEYFADTEIKKNIGDAYRFYYLKLIQVGDGFFEVPMDIDLVQFQEAYDLSVLPAAKGLLPFVHVAQLHRYITTGTIPLFKNEGRFRANIQVGSGVGDSYRPLWKLRGHNLILMPYPQFAQPKALKLEYIYMPTFPDGSSANAFLFDDQFPDVYEHNVELRAGVKCLESKDATGGVSDIATFRAELEAADAAMMETLEREEQGDQVNYVGINYNNPWWGSVI